MANDLTNHAFYEASIKVIKDKIQRAFRLVNTWNLGRVVYLENTGLSLYFALCIFHQAVSVSFHNEPVINASLSSVRCSNKLIKPNEGVFGTPNL